MTLSQEIVDTTRVRQRKGALKKKNVSEVKSRNKYEKPL